MMVKLNPADGSKIEFPDNKMRRLFSTINVFLELGRIRLQVIWGSKFSVFNQQKYFVLFLFNHRCIPIMGVCRLFSKGGQNPPRVVVVRQTHNICPKKILFFTTQKSLKFFYYFGLPGGGGMSPIGEENIPTIYFQNITHLI